MWVLWDNSNEGMSVLNVLNWSFKRMQAHRPAQWVQGLPHTTFLSRSALTAHICERDFKMTIRLFFSAKSKTVVNSSLTFWEKFSLANLFFWKKWTVSHFSRHRKPDEKSPSFTYFYTKFWKSAPHSETALLPPCFHPLSSMWKVQQSFSFSRKLKVSILAVDRGLNVLVFGLISRASVLHWNLR